MENMNIKAIVSMLGVNEHTLRAWERRHKAITPARNDQGRRAYSAKDIERLKLLVALVNRGHNIGTIAGLTNAKLAAFLDSTQANEAPISLQNSPVRKTSKHLFEILAPLEKFDLEKLNQALLHSRFELSPRELVLNLVLPLMAKVGLLVSEGKLSIAQEHILSSLLRDHIGQIYHSLHPYDFSARAGAKSFALTTREGDVHEFGILISAILCALHRKKTHYLGPNMPALELVAACKQFGVGNVVLGMQAIPVRNEIISAQEYLEIVDEKLPKQVAIWIGGGAPLNTKNLSKKRKIFLISHIEEFDQHLSRGL